MAKTSSRNNFVITDSPAARRSEKEEEEEIRRVSREWERQEADRRLAELDRRGREKM